MSARITDYTSYDNVRAALGVSEDDLEDETLALDLYADALELEFDDVSSGFAALYAAANTADTPSDAQEKLLTVTRLFAAYAVAKHLTASLPLFAAKQVTDSKAAVQRFDNPYRDTIKAVADRYGTLRTRLESAVDTLASSTRTSVTKTYFAVVGSAVDPITDSE